MTSLQLLDDLRIIQAASGESHLDSYEVKLTELTGKLKLLKAQPKETKTYKALLLSLTRQKEEYSRLVDFGDIPSKNQKELATLELLLTRIDECLEDLSSEGVTYEHVVSVFPRLKKLMDDE